ncbi:MAG: hypothetical protein ACYDCH_08925 [Gaiellaceae bacterium]
MFGRIQLSIATAAAALVAAPVASAALPSPIPSVRAAHVVHIATISHHTAAARSCSAQRSRAGATERKILPVACEQPPWVNVLGNQHKQAALAVVALLGG